jgi:hypothetical protein
VSTDNVGLARLDEGLELVRIGEPKRPEFSAWRYGDQFGRRFRKNLALTTATGIIGVGMLTAGPVLGVLGTFAYLGHEAFWWALWLHRRRRRVLDVDQHGTRMAVRASDADYIRLVPQETGEGWALSMRPGGRKAREVVLSGAAALHATARIVPHLTDWGAMKRQTRAAVDRIEAAGDPDRFLNQLARNPQRRQLDPRIYGWSKAEAAARDFSLKNQGHEVCLAVEMAVNEEHERSALDGELALLEDAWKDAEEIAAIADRLTLPSGVEEQVAEMKRKAAG